MNYKNNNNLLKDTVLFRCNCYEFSFLEFGSIKDEDFCEYYFLFTDEPKSFIERLKYLFRPHGRRNGIEILLSKDDIRILKERLDKELRV